MKKEKEKEKKANVKGKKVNPPVHVIDQNSTK